ncbi:DUF3817 domain-containing protein [Brevundimonas sp.]|uniref:DUF3817 domain-containing protein n=1 Tax=Brevundimonas sp. TaxID=1871086 RepID=UPI0028B02116|nr:DUF3817 domain-containing protein [Brevundimonas sp.]
MIQSFRLIAFIEGVTTLLLFFVAMPLKYLADWPHLTPHAGMIHGVAWIAYTPAIPICLLGRGFTPWELLRTFLAGLVPLGTFLNDGMIRRRGARRPVRL